MTDTKDPVELARDTIRDLLENMTIGAPSQAQLDAEKKRRDVLMTLARAVLSQDAAIERYHNSLCEAREEREQALEEADTARAEVEAIRKQRDRDYEIAIEERDHALDDLGAARAEVERLRGALETARGDIVEDIIEDLRQRQQDVECTDDDIDPGSSKYWDGLESAVEIILERYGRCAALGGEG